MNDRERATKTHRALRVLAGVTPVVVFALLFFRGGLALADVTKDQCVDANANAQPLRRHGRFQPARGQLQICVDAHCPPMVRDDCASRLDEIERLQPTLVFEAKDGVGVDLVAVRVTADGELLTERLDGTEVAVDPGEHTFVFQSPGHLASRLRRVLHEGEKGRRQRVVLEAAATPAASPSVPSVHSSAGDERGSVPPQTRAGSGAAARNGRTVLAWALGGVGAASVGVGGVFGVLTILASNDSKRECSAPANCQAYAQAVSDHSAALTDGAISTIAFALAGVAVAAELTLWLTAPSDSVGPGRASALHISPRVGRGSIGVTLGTEL